MTPLDKKKSFMSWAIALALEGFGNTSPNPIVGAVIVKGGRIVGEGFHRRAGAPHAEIAALKDAGKKARGAEMYVTLEPCVHHGRTPPCVPAIIKAGIKKVYVGTRDPNPVVNGRGIRALKKAGVEVTTGVLEENCRKINEPYNKLISTGMPFVVAKAALSLDGKIAAAKGDSKWITNEECRRYVHELRSFSDAIIIGAGTAKRDNPRLDVRCGVYKGFRPVAVIVDSRLSIPLSLKLFRRPKGELIIATTNKASAWKIKQVEKLGHEVIVCRREPNGFVNMKDMLLELGKRQFMSVLVEGGGKIFSTLFRKKLADRAVLCIAPKLIGAGGLDLLPGFSAKKMSDSISIKDPFIRSFGDNWVVEGNL